MGTSSPSFRCGPDDVSRETLERLAIFERLLRKWSTKINLVSRGTLDGFTDRHVRDSSQIYRLAPPQARHWLDMGSGGGLPGLVIGILAAECNQAMRLTLIEADQRKAVFLSLVAQECGVAADVIPARIEDVPSLNADVVSARALAPLDRLLGYAVRHLGSGGVCLFPKGVTSSEEVAAARQAWEFDLVSIPSQTLEGAAILRITAPKRKTGQV